MERVKHQVSGGWWEEGGKYVQAGEGVQEVFDSKDFQRRLGWVVGQSLKPGMRTSYSMDLPLTKTP